VFCQPFARFVVSSSVGGNAVVDIERQIRTVFARGVVVVVVASDAAVIVVVVVVAVAVGINLLWPLLLLLRLC